MPTEDFQRDSVAWIKRSVKAGRRRLGLADEVGLGKTHVIGEAAKSLLTKKGDLVFYLSPSMTVASQNGPRLVSLITGKRPGPHRRMLTRVTMLPILTNEQRQWTVVPLTPETSFHLRGAGDRHERAFLWQVWNHLDPAPPGHRRGLKFGRNKVVRWQDLFFRPSRLTARTFYQSQAFHDWREESKGHRTRAARFCEATKAAVPKLREDIEAAVRRVLESGPRSRSETIACGKAIVEALRLWVADQVLHRTERPKVVVFDEWHRYADLFKKDTLLKRTSDRWTKRRGPRVQLFVSATPFEVDLSSPTRHGASLMEALRILNPHEVADIEGLASRFFDNWLDLVKVVVGKNKKISRAKARDNLKASADKLGKAIKRSMIRTERPPTEIRPIDSVPVDVWTSSRLDLLAKLDQKRLRAGDLTGLWLSSSHFPVMSDLYEIARKLQERSSSLKKGQKKPKSFRLCQQEHWKLAKLRERLRVHFGEDSAGAFRPPLWIRPLSKGGHHGKILVFSNWNAVPREVSHLLHDDRKTVFRLARRRKLTSLGVFGVAAEHTGWRVFWPSEIGAGTYLDFPRFLAFVRSERSENQRKRPSLTDIAVALDHAYADFAQTATGGIKSRAVELGAKRAISWRPVLGALSDAELGNALRDLSCLGKKASMPQVRRGLAELPGTQFLTALRAAALDAELPTETVNDPTIQPAIISALTAMNHFFQRAFVQRVVRHAYPGIKQYPHAVKRYCLDYHWHDMLKEYLSLLLEHHRDGAPADRLKACLGDLTESMSAWSATTGAWANKTNAATVVQALMEPKHPGRRKKKKGKTRPKDDDQGEARRRMAFNSPFPPHVLVTTSVGQEGIDLHRYCDSVVHWNPPDSPLALEQREGRVDRFLSFQVRKAMPDGDKSNSRRGLHPRFCVVDKNDLRINYTNREVWTLPYSREEQVWHRCLKRQHYFRLLLGAPNPAALEAELHAEFQDANDEAKVFEELRNFHVELAPPERKNRS